MDRGVLDQYQLSYDIISGEQCYKRELSAIESVLAKFPDQLVN